MRGSEQWSPPANALGAIVSSAIRLEDFAAISPSLTDDRYGGLTQINL
jgi:hypothetical protein